jgi:hypothetical protein
MPVASMRSGTVRRRKRGDQSDWLVDEDVVPVVAAFIGDIEDIAKAFGGDEDGDRPLALDDGVGRERRAVDEEVDLARSHADLR